MPSEFTMELDGEKLLADVRRLRLEPDDVVVVCCDRMLSKHQAEQVRDYVKAAITGNEVLVLSNGLSIHIVSKGVIDGAH